MIRRVELSTGAAAGTAGSATATGYSRVVKGEVLSVAVTYQDSPPAATTDFTLQDESDPQSENIVNLANAATDLRLYPRRPVEDNTNSGLTFDGSNIQDAPYLVHGRLAATIAGANAGDSVDVVVWLRE